MSCIAGVGGGVKPLVRTATSGRPVVAIDGCPLARCEKVLRARGVEPEQVVRLHELGLRKRQRVDFDADLHSHEAAGGVAPPGRAAAQAQLAALLGPEPELGRPVCGLPAGRRQRPRLVARGALGAVPELEAKAAGSEITSATRSSAWLGGHAESSAWGWACQP